MGSQHSGDDPDSLTRSSTIQISIACHERRASIPRLDHRQLIPTGSASAAFNSFVYFGLDSRQSANQPALIFVRARRDESISSTSPSGHGQIATGCT